ncbi:IS1 family transposase [Phormidium sp. CCY1219]|uniref:IS1 family transposase n=1 Tax=Phormidium sp. CCY1219 TaxID=2886104 RepID=UPI002D1F39A9|nr:IS1 family transposase [Phormidium sp. CCY1219]MEB3828480.1 IS1 family transposase [Phormidium sp. CCY1219]
MNYSCPTCLSNKIIKNGSTHHKKQKYLCKECGRQFVELPQKKYISSEFKTLIDRLLLEKIPLAGIARALDVSYTWLQNYVNKKYEETPREIKVSEKQKGKSTIQCDELWSFVGKKENKIWSWLALDVKTREIVGVFLGDRSKKSAEKLWDSLPPVYRQCAVCYTDFWESYTGVIATKRHKAVDKKSRLTSHIERFNNTLRQRVSRLVRKTLSFSKKLENHIGAVWYFIHYYNSLKSVKN